MKKFVTLALALVMVLALSVTAFAATAELGDDADKTATDDITITATYTAYIEAAEVVEVDVEWNGTAFAYAAGSQGTWNADEMKYDNVGEAAWTGSLVIDIDNRSNVAVDVTAAWTAAEGQTTATMDFDDAEVTVAAADAEAHTAGEATITGTMTGSIAAASDNLGKVVISIA